MKKKILLLSLLYSFSIISQENKNNKIFGQYKIVKQGFYSILVEIKKNKTFKIRYDGHHTYAESKGEFNFKGKQNYALTSFLQPKNDFIVEENQSPNTGTEYQFLFSDKFGEILSSATCIVYINGNSKEYSADNEAILRISKTEKIDSIKVKYIGFKDVFYIFNDIKVNQLVIQMDEITAKELYYWYLNNKLIEIKDEKLIWDNDTLVKVSNSVLSIDD